MKSKIALFLFISFLLVSSSALFAQSQERALDDALKTLAGVLADDIVTGKSVAVAISEFGNTDGTTGGKSGAFGRYIAFAFPSYLKEAGRGRFTLVDRDSTSRILAEQEFQMSSLDSNVGRVALGKFLSCDTLVLGKIDYSEPEALTLVAKAVRVDTGVLLGSFAKRLSLSMEVKALVGKEEVDSNAATRLNANASAPYSISMVTVSGAKPMYRNGEETWVAAKPGEEYQLELRNNTDRRVGVSLLIDGLNTILMRRESPAAAIKWILEPRSRAIIKGWQQDTGTAKKFVFTGKDKSLAAIKGFGAEIGLISASFYPEELSPKSGSPQEAGTAAGETIESKVTAVKINLEGKPVQVSIIHYDYPNGLAARGIKVNE